MSGPSAVMTVFRTLSPSRLFINARLNSTLAARSWNCLDGERENITTTTTLRRCLRTSACSQWRLDSRLAARNQSNRKEKFCFDPDLGSDNIDVKGKIMTTVNEAVVFEHFNQKGRRLPRV